MRVIMSRKKRQRESERERGAVRLFDFTNAFAILFYAGDVTTNC